ncbi:MAG: oligosaccharide flippase family protein [Candidatus Aceula meridiana]|nr:oligosaccharide flippase family protein [Candidatus Aceula meridiana]
MKIKQFLKTDFLKHSAIVFAGTSLVGVFNLLYHLVSVRILTPEDYGTFNALIALVTFSSMTFSPLRTTLARFFTEYIAKKDYQTLINVSRRIFLRTIFVSIGVFLFFVFFSGPLAEFFKTQNYCIIIIGGIISLSLLSLLVAPIFQSFQKFKSFSFLGIFSSSGKLVLGGFLMVFGFGLSGALVGFLVAPLLVLFFGLIALFLKRKEVFNFKEKYHSSVNLTPIYRYFLPVSLAVLSFSVLTNIDIVLVKRFFSPLDAGQYSVAQIVGKIFLYFPSALAIVIFPKSTQAYVTKSHSNKILYKALILAASMSGVGVIICFLFPGSVLQLLTGKANPISNNLVGLFAFSMSFYALLWIVVNFLLATHNLRFLKRIIFCAIAQTVAIWFFHSTLKQVLVIVFMFSVISFFGVLFCVNDTKDNLR